MRAFLAAVGFLTVLPVRAPADPERLAPARAYFPLVGLMLGCVLVLLDVALRRLFPVGLASALVLAALVAATRGLHFEGFLDCCDALFGGFTRERRLEILKDPHVGAFAVMGGGLLLLVTWTALNALSGPARFLMLLLFPCLSRWAMLLAMAAFPYARPQGLGTAFTAGAAPSQVGIGLATAAAAALVLAGPAGIILLIAASAAAWGIGRWMARLLGGLTGDCYGAINELAAVAVLLLSIALAAAGTAPAFLGGLG